MRPAARVQVDEPESDLSEHRKNVGQRLYATDQEVGKGRLWREWFGSQVCFAITRKTGQDTRKYGAVQPFQHMGFVAQTCRRLFIEGFMEPDGWAVSVCRSIVEIHLRSALQQRQNLQRCCA